MSLLDLVGDYFTKKSQSSLLTYFLCVITLLVFFSFHTSKHPFLLSASGPLHVLSSEPESIQVPPRRPPWPPHNGGSPASSTCW